MDAIERVQVLQRLQNLGGDKGNVLLTHALGFNQLCQRAEIAVFHDNLYNTRAGNQYQSCASLTLSLGVTALRHTLILLLNR
jgi:hypothetical protein